jgi:hypothetical protein
MIAWIKEINWGKTLLVGILYTVFAAIVRQVETMLTMPYYLDPTHFGLWSKLMMPKAGPPPAEFMMMSVVITLATGISIAVIYYYIKEMLPKKTTKRVFFFADLMIGFSFIFFTLPTYMLFNIPMGLLVSWFISTFVILLFASIISVKIIGK